MTEQEAARLIDGYCTCWRVMAPKERRDRLAELLAPQVRYVDPQTDVTGIAALSEHIGAVAAARPGARVERASAVDLHHDVARFAWRLVDGDEVRLAGSIDVVSFEAGRIATIIGFFGPVRDGGLG